jgi:hypothetical protein
MTIIAILPLALLAEKAAILNLQACSPGCRLFGFNAASTACSLSRGDIPGKGGAVCVLKLQRNLGGEGPNHDLLICCRVLFVKLES